MSDNQIRISGKDLGELALPNFCPRCLWLKRHAPMGLPYQIFPGIFSSIDAYTKRVVHGWFDRYNVPPPWLHELGALNGYINPPHYSKFNIVNEEYNVLLTGAPDGIFIRPDGSNIIIDYKTAKYTGGQGKLFPMYEVQLNSYALIGEKCGLSPVSGLALVYTEPITSQDHVTQGVEEKRDIFAIDFCAKTLAVPLDTSIIPPLLEKLREIYDLPSAPISVDGCKECLKIEGLLGIIERGGHPFVN